jgi:hypothetical protein
MKCQAPYCDEEATKAPVIRCAFEDPNAPPGQIMVMLPLCDMHAQHDPADLITDGAYEDLCATLEKQGKGKPVRASITVEFEPLPYLADSQESRAVARLFKAQ